MKVIEDVLLKRTSVRRYEREKIEPEKLDLIYRAIASTPTSYNGQQYSVIAVEDQEKKELLYEIIGQKQIKTSAVFLVFCVDFNKVSLLAKAKELDFPRIQDKMDGVMIGLIDAALAMQNAVVAAQSLGLEAAVSGMPEQPIRLVSQKFCSFRREYLLLADSLSVILGRFPI